MRPARAAPSAAAIVPLTARIAAVEPELADARVLCEPGRAAPARRLRAR